MYAAPLWTIVMTWMSGKLQNIQRETGLKSVLQEVVLKMTWAGEKKKKKKKEEEKHVL